MLTFSFNCRVFTFIPGENAMQNNDCHQPQDLMITILSVSVLSITEVIDCKIDIIIYKIGID